MEDLEETLVAIFLWVVVETLEVDLVSFYDSFAYLKKILIYYFMVAVF